MQQQIKGNLLLEPYKVLDLTEGGFMISGKILADLGANVIKIEPPWGSRSRDIGPFYQDIADREKSLFWFAYNANKKSITLDLETVDGQDIFRKLANSADVVLESFKPGYLDNLGIGYKTLRQLNPSLIMTSVTPFGQDGPKAWYNSSELAVWASAGILYISGDPDRPPSWVSYPQSYLHGGAQAAAGTLLALYHRRSLDAGQYVDVSTQACLVKTITNAHLMWEMMHKEIVRIGIGWGVGTSGRKGSAKLGFRCKDGFVAVNLFGGGSRGIVEATRRVVKWMDEEGMAPKWFRDFDWVHDYDWTKVSQETVYKVEEQWSRFFLTKTKAELFEEAIKRRLPIAPANNSKDLMESPQLNDRGFWQKVEHPELHEKLTYCGSFARISGASLDIRRRAPLIGEHNIEVYENELGYSRDDLILLMQAGAI
ncbi:CaiB/BaiF CoA transferase family protein [Chloroflexota bacterium]